MKQSDIDQAFRLFLALLRYEICGTDLPEHEIKVSNDLLEKVYLISAKHQLAHLAYAALVANNLLKQDDSLYQKFRRIFLNTLLHIERSKNTLQGIRVLFKEKKDDFIVLKGGALCSLYPESWMRNSCDIDILVREEGLGKASEALIQKGYTFNGKTLHNSSFFSPQKVHVELHFKLNDSMFKDFSILENVWDTAAHDESENEYVLSDEVLYFYHVAHMAKHIANGGCGIRPFIDLWLLNHRTEYDAQKRTNLLKKEGLLAFETAAVNLSEVWFSNGQPDETSRMLEEYILFGGAYGNSGNKQAVMERNAGGAREFLFRRVFAPYEKLKALYPVVTTHKWLTPAFQVARWFRLTSKKSRKNAMQQIQERKCLNESKREGIEALFSKLEI